MLAPELRVITGFYPELASSNLSMIGYLSKSGIILYLFNTDRSLLQQECITIPGDTDIQCL